VNDNPKKDPDPPKKDPDPPKDPDPQGNFDDTLKEARTAFMNGQFGKALAKAEEALGYKPGNQEAITVAAMAACKSGKPDKGKRYLSMLKGTRQNQAKSYCLQAGVQFD
jgi:hypothetical protein